MVDIEKNLNDLASEDDSKYTDEEWNQKLIDVSEKTNLSVEEVLEKISDINEQNKFFEEDAEKEYWENNSEV
jgi:hypothetical protein